MRGRPRSVSDLSAVICALSGPAPTISCFCPTCFILLGGTHFPCSDHSARRTLGPRPIVVLKKHCNPNVLENRKEYHPKGVKAQQGRGHRKSPKNCQQDPNRPRARDGPETANLSIGRAKNDRVPEGLVCSLFAPHQLQMTPLTVSKQRAAELSKRA